MGQVICNSSPPPPFSNDKRIKGSSSFLFTVTLTLSTSQQVLLGRMTSVVSVLFKEKKLLTSEVELPLKQRIDVRERVLNKLGGEPHLWERVKGARGKDVCAIPVSRFR